MSTLHDFVGEFLSALTTACKQATDAHTAADKAAATFYTSGERLKGNIEGKGADAFFNAFAVNNQRCQLLLAKLNDYFNASSSLQKGVEAMTATYDNFDTYHAFGMGMEIDPVRYPVTAYEVWQRLRTAFVTNAILDMVLNQSTAASAIAEALNAGRDQIFAEIDRSYSDIPDMQTTVNKLRQEAGSNSLEYQNASTLLQNLQDEQSAARTHVQTIVSNMQTNLQDWSYALNLLMQTYINEVGAAARIDQIALSDLIYEANLPQNAQQNVLIEQLPDGSLLILVRGGDAASVENTIKNYLQLYGYAGQNTPITLVGYGSNGEGVAQKIIQDAHNPRNALPFQIANALMVGNNVPDPTNLPTNYLVYVTQPTPISETFLGLSRSDYAEIGLSLLLAIPTEGSSILAEGGVISAKAILETAGSLGVGAIDSYAADLGYNSSHPTLESEAEFLAQRLQNYPAYVNNISISVDGGKTVKSVQEYLQQSGGSINFRDPNVKIYYKGVTVVPSEIGLNTSNLGNDAYLGTQFIPDPKGASQQQSGVSQPVQGTPGLGE